MQVLVVSKTTNLDLHGEKIRKQINTGLPVGHLQRLELAHREHYQTLDLLTQTLQDRGIEYRKISRGRFWPNLSAFDYVITVGGDGTVLEASHHMSGPEVGLVGIRSSHTSVGHLCAGGSQDVESVVDGLISGQTKFCRLSRLRAAIEFCLTGGVVTTDPILNDFLFTNRNPAATTRYRLQKGDVIEDHKSSGIWISTAAGSTAAIAAAGGLPMELTSRSFQYRIRELYTPPGSEAPTLMRGDFDPESDWISIENRTDHGILALDGQHGSMSLSFGDKIKFVRAKDLNLAVR